MAFVTSVTILVTWMQWVRRGVGPNVAHVARMSEMGEKVKSGLTLTVKQKVACQPANVGRKLHNTWRLELEAG